MYEQHRVVHKAPMRSGSPTRAYEAMRGWRATTVRALSLVLAPPLVAPDAINSAESYGGSGSELSVSAAPDGTSPGRPDGCPACHASCGCHQAISPDGPFRAPAAEKGRLSYAPLDVVVVSVSPDRLPRPPRA
jgi:hypothetical protein